MAQLQRFLFELSFGPGEYMLKQRVLRLNEGLGTGYK